MFAETHRGVVRELAYQRAHNFLTLKEWQHPRVIAIEVQNVKDEEGHVSFLLALERCLQRRKAAKSRTIGNYDLSVEHRILHWNLAHRFSNLGHAMRPVQTFSR